LFWERVLEETIQIFLWSLFIQFLTAFFGTPTGMLHTDSSSVNQCSDPILTTWSAISLPQSLWPGIHNSWTLIHWASFTRTDGVVPDQFRVDLVIGECFNSAQNIDIFFFVDPVCIPCCTCLDSRYFCWVYAALKSLKFPLCWRDHFSSYLWYCCMRVSLHCTKFVLSYAGILSSYTWVKRRFRILHNY
jgi:hypothetical protein